MKRREFLSSLAGVATLTRSLAANEKELKRQFMAECHISKKFPLDSLKAICIADECSIKNKGYNFGEFYDNVKSRISRESVLTEKNIEQRRDLFFEGRYG